MAYLRKGTAPSQLTPCPISHPHKAAMSTNMDKTTEKPTDNNPKEVWFTPNVQEIPSDARELLETYGKFPSNEVCSRTSKFQFTIQNQMTPHHLTPLIQRRKAFKMFPYTCIGQFRFLSLNLRSHNPLPPPPLASPNQKFKNSRHRLLFRTRHPTARHRSSASGEHLRHRCGTQIHRSRRVLDRGNLPSIPLTNRYI